MLKVEIKINEKSINEKGIYNLIGIYNYLDALFSANNLVKVGSIGGSVFYKGTGRDTDMASIFNCVFHLEKKDWFMENAEKFLLYDNDNGSSEDDFDIEDILVQSRNKLAKLSRVV